MESIRQRLETWFFPEIKREDKVITALGKLARAFFCGLLTLGTVHGVCLLKHVFSKKAPSEGPKKISIIVKPVFVTLPESLAASNDSEHVEKAQARVVPESDATLESDELEKMSLNISLDEVVNSSSDHKIRDKALQCCKKVHEGFNAKLGVIDALLKKQLSQKKQIDLNSSRKALQDCIDVMREIENGLSTRTDIKKFAQLYLDSTDQWTQVLNTADKKIYSVLARVAREQRKKKPSDETIV